MFQVLPADKLYYACQAREFKFSDTSELEPLSNPLGQERALDAIEFSIDIDQPGFNLFVLGAAGFGKHELVQQVLAKRKTPDKPFFDWCYVNNFDNPQKPKLLKLPAGMGQHLSQNMKQFVEDLLTAVPAAFQSEEYQRRRQEIEEESQLRFEKAFKSLDEEAREQSIALMRTPSGYTMAPIINDKVITAEEFDKLDKAEKERIEKVIANMQLKLQKIIRDMPLVRREISHQVKALNQEITKLTVEQFIAWIENQYGDYPEIISYLQAVKKNAIENAQDFLPNGDNPEVEKIEARVQAFHMYQVNVIVDNTGCKTPPVIFEDNPTYQNLVGRIEHVSQMGTLLTDFTLIKSGALHRANGGYLIIDAQKVLTHMYAWEGLKRSIKSRQVKISSLEEALSLVSTLSLEPESIPIDVKIILLGEPRLYYLLKHYDLEFDELFKVAADFSHHTERSLDNHLLFARLIATKQQELHLKPVEAGAVAKIIEQSSRHTGDSEKLSLQIEYISDLLKEADYWAGKSSSPTIALSHIKKALEKQRYRHDRVRVQFHEQITRGINLIDTAGNKTAQANGLSVLSLAGHAFGSPTRITATARLGQGRVIDIEREVKLGGEIHSKGVLILTAYMASHYAQNQPLPLSASLVFEQSYGGVDGDSATAIELCVLLSAIADIPLKQSLAVTGSMNQLGQLQAIGGVNEKIEGFYDICKARRLTGEQGVVIPASNRVHLMLREDIRDAVSNGDFAIYTADHVEDVMTLLSGLPAGEADEQGAYPKDSFNGRIHARIEELIQLHKKFGATERTSEKSVNTDNNDD